VCIYLLPRHVPHAPPISPFLVSTHYAVFSAILLLFASDSPKFPRAVC
jgi:hypothetical protein